jgi:hypothetical protein
MSTNRISRYTDPTPLKTVWNCIESTHVHPHAEYENNIERTFQIPGFEYHDEERTEETFFKGKRDWKDFEHYKAFRSSSCLGGPEMFHQFVDYYPHIWGAWMGNGRVGMQPADSEVSSFGEPSMPTQGMRDPFRAYQSNGDIIPNPIDLESLIQRGLIATMPEAKQELSIINSAIELRDFRSLPRTLDNIRKLAVNRFSTLRNWFRGGADGYLQLKFNVLPLLSDISGIHSAVIQLEKRVNRLLSEAGQPRRRHMSFTWSEYPDGRDDSSGYLGLPPFSSSWGATLSNPYNYFYLTRIVRHSQSVFHFEVEYNYNYTQYQREHAHLLTLLDNIGINFDPKIIWNAIPWSFVVDWVFDVSRWLDQFKVSNMEPQINIRRCLWSVKRSRDLYFERVNTSLYGSQFTYAKTCSMPAVKETAYKRRIFMPSYNSLLASGLTSNEVSLGAALVLSRRRRSKRR